MHLGLRSDIIPRVSKCFYEITLWAFDNLPVEDAALV